MYLDNEENSPIWDMGSDMLNAESNKTTKGSGNRRESKPAGHLAGIFTWSD